MDHRMATWIVWFVGLTAGVLGTTWVLNLVFGPPSAALGGLMTLGLALALGRGTFPDGRRH